MAFELRDNLDLNNNEIQNVVVEKQASTPGTGGVAGRLVYVTSDNKLYLYNGTSWIALTTSESGEYQLVDEKNQANGYAGLDGNSKITYAQIPTGVTANTIPLIVSEIANGQGIKYDQASGGFIPFDISTLYTFKGSCTSEELDQKTASAQTGDVWNVSTPRAYNGTTSKAGTNWAFDSTEPASWEPLTGIIDLSGYQTVGNMVTDVGATASTGIDDSHYPSALATKTAIDAVRAIASNAVVANPGITAGTHTKITYDAKGLVTGGTGLAASDIPDISATYVAVSRLGTDVATLSSGKVPLTQLPTGNGENLIPVLPSAGTAGQALVVNSNADGFTFRTVPSHSITSVEETWTGDGATATKTIPISFEGNRPSAVTIYDASGNIVYANVKCTTSQVTITMSPAPTSDETFTIRIIG